MADEAIRDAGVDAGASGGQGGVEAQSPAEATQGGSELTIGTILNEDGTFKEGWTSVLGDDYKDNPSLKKFSSFEALAGSHVNAQKLIGKKNIGFADMDEDQRAQLYKDMGVPETAEEYGFKAPEDMPEDMQYNEAQDKWFAEKAKELKLTKAQASTLRDEFNAMSIAQQKAMITAQADADAKALVEGEKILREKHGAEYDKVIVGAQKFAETFGLTDSLVQSGLATDPAFIEKMYEASQSLGEDKLISSKSDSGMSPNEARVELNELMADPAYLDATHIKHKSTVARVTKLFEQLNK